MKNVLRLRRRELATLIQQLGYRFHGLSIRRSRAQPPKATGVMDCGAPWAG
jgi:hypothetical protein